MLRKLNELTQFKGCMGRQAYWVYMLAAAAFGFIGGLAKVGMVYLLKDMGNDTLRLAFVLTVDTAFTIVALIIYLSAVVRRLHDVNMSGYFSLLFLVAGLFWPVALVLVILLGIIPAKHGNNQSVKKS